MQEIKFYEKYLGLPSLVVRGKRASFNYIKERVWRKLQEWEAKLLSQVGREVLIKSVIHAISIFVMGCFKLPVSLCHEVEAMVKTFWWDRVESFCSMMMILDRYSRISDYIFCSMMMVFYY